MKVCIDPGHGGYDPGTEGNGLCEKDLTLDISLMLKPILEYNGITAILTREGDYPPGHLAGDHKGELRARVEIAEKNKVDLFVSIHINAGGGSGQEILIIGKGGRAEMAAKKVLPYVVQAGSWTKRGLKVQNALVLRETTMPAILTENGFIDNSADAKKLKDSNFRYGLAKAHAQGICDYFGIHYKDPDPGPLSINYEAKYRVIVDNMQSITSSSQEKQINTQVRQKNPIMGNESITIEQCRQFLQRYNPSAPDLIPFYKKYGKLLGIRWGLAVAQMIKETGYLQYSGDVLPEQNNFAGIGAVGKGARGAFFSSPEEGVLAHLEHLYAYAVVDPLPKGIPLKDPRFELVKRGNCPNWEDLNGCWAVPGNGYGEDIVAIYAKLAAEVVSSPETPNENTAATPWLRKVTDKLIKLIFNRQSYRS